MRLLSFKRAKIWLDINILEPNIALRLRVEGMEDFAVRPMRRYSVSEGFSERRLETSRKDFRYSIFKAAYLEQLDAA